MHEIVVTSSAGANWKVGARSAGKEFWSCPSTFLAPQVLVVWVSAFVTVS